MRISYRKALNSGKRNRVSRVVATFFDLCNQIWSGSPATESMSSGLDGAVDSTDAHSHNFDRVWKIQHFNPDHQPCKQLVTMIGQTNLIRMKILKAI